MKNLRFSTAFALVGAAGMTAQVLTLRELLAGLRGNELAVGLALSIWLVMTGTTAWMGGRVMSRRARGAGALGWSFAAMAVLIPAAVVAPRVLMPALGYSSAALVPFSGIVVVTAATLALAAPAIGLMFPFSVSAAGLAGGGAARVYMLESLGGAAAGAAFTFVVAPLFTPIQGAAACSLVCAAGAALVSPEGGRRRFGALSAVCAVLALGLFAAAPGLELYTLNISSHAGGRVVDARWSKYGEISVVELPGQHAVYRDGGYCFSVPDPDTAGALAHLAMLVHQAPGRVLLIGGGIEVASEMLKHPVERLDYVELDPELIDALRGYLSGGPLAALSDPRLVVHATDGRLFVKNAGAHGERYDMVVVQLPEPSTAMVNRYYTLEFFREVNSILAPGGVFSIGLPASPNYINRTQLRLTGTVYHTLRAVFGYVRVTPEETNRFFASQDPGVVSFDPDVLSRRYAGRGIRAAGFDEHTPLYMLMPGRVRYVEERLASAHGLGLNTDESPVAYVYSLALWGETSGFGGFERLLELARGGRWFGPGMLAGAFMLCAAAAFTLRRSPPGMASLTVATTGFSGITLELAALLYFQSHYGYLYEMVGLLIAAFMLGLFAGSYAGSRLSTGEGRQASRLAFAEAALALTGLALVRPVAPPGVSAGAVILMAGFLTGMEYPLALGLASGGGGPHEAYAGRIYGLDLLGSGLGALICGLVLVPLMGIANAVFFVVILKSTMAAALAAGGRIAH